MFEYRYVGTGEHLRQERKRSWQAGQLAAEGYFVHGGGMTPARVHTFGLSPIYANEFLTFEETGEPIEGGKMVFTFQLAGGDFPANVDAWRKSPAVGREWGYGGHCYVFRAPVGTRYWSTRAVLATGAEVAFPYVIESSDIVQYWAPSGSRNAGIEFMKVSWNSVVASLARSGEYGI